MKTTHKILTLILISTSMNLYAQNQPPISDAPTGVNPMTGRSLSEEDLARQLSKAKLATQLGQEAVKQAQNNAELALATLRQEAEKARLRTETMGLTSQSKSTVKTGKQALTVIKPLSGKSPTSSSHSNHAMGSNMFTYPSAPPAPVQPASGTMRIGDETIPVVAQYQGSAAQVQSVDSQTLPATRTGTGTSIQPINVQPATGILGIPAIPGLQLNRSSPL